MKLGWFCIILGGILEIFWVSGLKYSTSLLAYIITGILVFCSFTLAIIATKKIEVSIAYAVFTGIGAAGVALSEIVVFGASTSPLQLTFIALLILSVIGLKLANKENGKQELKITQEFSQNSSIDTVAKKLETLESIQAKKDSK